MSIRFINGIKFRWVMNQWMFYSVAASVWVTTGTADLEDAIRQSKE